MKYIIRTFLSLSESTSTTLGTLALPAFGTHRKCGGAVCVFDMYCRGSPGPQGSSSDSRSSCHKSHLSKEHMRAYEVVWAQPNTDLLGNINLRRGKKNILLKKMHLHGGTQQNTVQVALDLMPWTVQPCLLWLLCCPSVHSRLFCGTVVF